MPKAAPGPEFGRFYQSSPYRVGVYVVQLFNVLFFRSNIEVIRPGLPECGGQLFTKNIGLLFGGSFLSAALERNPLLQHLHNPGRILNFWFADQKVDVLRHDHVAGYDKLIFLACLLKDFKKHITVRGWPEKREPSVTGTGNEMPVALSVNADESFRHRLILYPTLRV